MFGNMKYSIIAGTVDTAGCFFTLVIRSLNMNSYEHYFCSLQCGISIVLERKKDYSILQWFWAGINVHLWVEPNAHCIKCQKSSTLLFVQHLQCAEQIQQVSSCFCNAQHCAIWCRNKNNTAKVQVQFDSETAGCVTKEDQKCWCNVQNRTISEVLTPLVLRIQAFWDMTPCH